MLVLNLSSKQILNVKFDKVSTLQDITKTMLQTAYAFPDDYPVVELPFAGRTIKAWHIGYKATGNRVFILKNGTLVTEKMHRIKEPEKVIWRLRFERD